MQTLQKVASLNIHIWDLIPESNALVGGVTAGVLGLGLEIFDVWRQGMNPMQRDISKEILRSTAIYGVIGGVAGFFMDAFKQPDLFITAAKVLGVGYIILAPFACGLRMIGWQNEAPRRRDFFLAP